MALNLNKDFQKIVLPLVRWIPVTIALIVIAAFITKRAIRLIEPLYESRGVIQVNASSSGASTELFDKTIISNNTNNKFLTELEVFTSQTLLKKVLKKINFELAISRVGKSRSTELFKDCPLIIVYEVKEEIARSKDYFIEYQGGEYFQFYTKKDKSDLKELSFGQLYENNALQISVHKNKKLLKSKPGLLKPKDLFSFEIRTSDEQLALVSDKYLFVKPVEKDIPIVKIFYKHKVARRAQMFVNALMDTYIEDYAERKAETVRATLEYVDNQLFDVGSKLISAELELATYKSTKDIQNPTLKIDANLKDLSKLKEQDFRLELQILELEKLYEYLVSGQDISSFAPNFKALNEKVFQDAYLKLKSYDLQKEELSLEYASSSQKMIAVNGKIKKLRGFLNRTIQITKKNLTSKLVEVKQKRSELEDELKIFPEKERRVVGLDREVKINEKSYNFLMEKKDEISIWAKLALYPHKIVDNATFNVKSVSPNKALYFGLSIFIGLLIGVLLSYILDFIYRKLDDFSEVKGRIDSPYLGEVYKLEEKVMSPLTCFESLLPNLKFLIAELQKKTDNNIMVLSSNTTGEGKSFISYYLAELLAKSGKTVLLIDANSVRPSLHKFAEMENNIGLTEWLKNDLDIIKVINDTHIPNLKVITNGATSDDSITLIHADLLFEKLSYYKSIFDLVIIDTAAFSYSTSAIPLMQNSFLNLVVLRKGYSRLRSVGELNAWFEKFALDHIYTVFNGGDYESENMTKYKINKFISFLKGDKINFSLKRRKKKEINTIPSLEHEK